MNLWDLWFFGLFIVVFGKVEVVHGILCVGFFVLLAVPLLRNVVLHTFPTGYDKLGRCRNYIGPQIRAPKPNPVPCLPCKKRSSLASVWFWLILMIRGYFLLIFDVLVEALLFIFLFFFVFVERCEYIWWQFLLLDTVYFSSSIGSFFPWGSSGKLLKGCAEMGWNWRLDGQSEKFLLRSNGFAEIGLTVKTW